MCEYGKLALLRGELFVIISKIITFRYMKPQEIKQLRTDLGWSQAQLGAKLGYTAPTVMKWEKGITAPPDLAIGVLSQLKRQLETKKSANRNDFIEKLTAVAITGGIMAFIAMIFKDDE